MRLIHFLKLSRQSTVADISFHLDVSGSKIWGICERMARNFPRRAPTFITPDLVSACCCSVHHQAAHKSLLQRNKLDFSERDGGRESKGETKPGLLAGVSRTRGEGSELGGELESWAQGEALPRPRGSLPAEGRGGLLRVNELSAIRSRNRTK